jgi:hypothetical protein
VLKLEVGGLSARESLLDGGGQLVRGDLQGKGKEEEAGEGMVSQALL